ncbi:MAG TPA: hypothetical protein DCS07_16565 [Bdellovibrionales bacterium]|nr:hypothetical protein [Bdellovibrionales bacterium]HCM39041.1 hypothetical protein [Bdellovibrionales bacterium]
MKIEQQIAESEWVVTRVTAHGTLLGEWFGIAPPAEKFSSPA